MINMWNLISVALDERNSMLQKWRWCDKWMNCYSIAMFQSHIKSWQFDISICVYTQFSAQQSICHLKTHMQMILNDYMLCVALDERNSTSQKWNWDDNCKDSMRLISMLWIKWLNCYYLKDKMRNMNSIARFCESVNLFWSRYSNFNLMWRLFVTSVIERKRSQRSRCVAWRRHAIHSWEIY